MKKEVVEKPKEVVAKKEIGIKVSDPQVLRPKELPLVITPEKGKWANEAQAEYAKVLNAYAYRNPEKWGKKKDILIKQLKEIGRNPKAITKYSGVKGGVVFNNKLLG